LDVDFGVGFGGFDIWVLEFALEFDVGRGMLNPTENSGDSGGGDDFV
jgi:hypothetical protein